MAHSPHRQWKGLRADNRIQKDRRLGRAWRDPWPVLRTLGKLRRISRHDLGDFLEDLYDDE